MFCYSITKRNKVITKARLVLGRLRPLLLMEVCKELHTNPVLYMVQQNHVYRSLRREGGGRERERVRADVGETEDGHEETLR